MRPPLYVVAHGMEAARQAFHGCRRDGPRVVAHPRTVRVVRPGAVPPVFFDAGGDEPPGAVECAMPVDGVAKFAPPGVKLGTHRGLPNRGQPHNSTAIFVVVNGVTHDSRPFRDEGFPGHDHLSRAGVLNGVDPVKEAARTARVVALLANDPRVATARPSMELHNSVPIALLVGAVRLGCVIVTTRMNEKNHCGSI